MEKVTFAPLIELLKENGENLNQLLRSIRTSSPTLDSGQIPVWFKQVIEPVFSAVHLHDPTKSRKVFDLLYRETLAILSGNFDRTLARDSLLLLGQNPALTASNPGQVFRALRSAVRKIAHISMPAAEKWLELMHRSMPMIKNYPELLKIGRIAAWRCGMAHLRGLIDDPASLAPEIMLLIFSGDKGRPAELKRRWEPNQPPIAAGAFTGFAGEFVRPPLVSLKNDLVLAFDGSSCRALFSDRFGTVFHDYPGANIESLKIDKRKSDADALCQKILKPYHDITSWLFHENTLYLTLSSSHSVMIFGGIDG